MAIVERISSDQIDYWYTTGTANNAVHLHVGNQWMHSTCRMLTYFVGNSFFLHTLFVRFGENKRR